MIDVDLRQPVGRPRRHPLLVEVVVHHHLRSRGRDALLGTLVAGRRKSAHPSVDDTMCIIRYENTTRLFHVSAESLKSFRGYYINVSQPRKRRRSHVFSATLLESFFAALPFRVFHTQ